MDRSGWLQSLRTHGDRWFGAALAAYGAAMTVRQANHIAKRPPGQLEDLDRGLQAGDFETFYRCALRMREGHDLYFAHTAGGAEPPSKQAPFFELLLQPLVGFGAPATAVVFGLLTIAALLHTLHLGRQLLAHHPEPLRRHAPLLATAVLLPTLHLNFLYFQTGVLLVWLFLLGLRALPRRPLLAGAIWSLGVSIKLIPIVLLCWALWRRQWRCLLGGALGLLLANGAVLAWLGPSHGLAQYRGFVAMLRADQAFGEYNERYQGLPPLVLATVTPHYASQVKSTAQQRDWQGVRNFLGDTPLAAHGGTLVLVAVGLVLAAVAWTCRRAPLTPLRAVQETSLVAIAMLLVSPHTWRHYYWWLWPTALLALQDVRRRRWANVAVVTLVIGELLPHRGLIGSLSLWWQVFHGPTLGALVVFAVLARHLARDDGAGPGT